MRRLIIPLMVLILPIIFYSVYLVNYSTKSYPNIFIGSIDVGNLTQEQITQKLNIELSKRQNQTFTFEIPQAEVKALKLNANLITYDVSSMAKAAFQKKRDEWYIAPITQLWQKQSVELIYDFDELTTDTLLADMLRPYEKNVLESKIKFENGDVFATVSKTGKLTERDTLRNIIKQYVTLQSNTVTTTVTFVEKKPTLTQENTRNAIAQTKIALGKPLILREPSTGYEKTINSTELFNLLEYQLDPTTQQATVNITNYKLSALLKDLPSSLNTNPIQGDSQQVGNFLIITEQAQSGTEVDIAQLTQTINKSLFTPGRSELVEIPIIRIEPSLTKAVANQYGIKDLLASGISSFKGSSDARLHNIRTAAAKLNGYLVAPNQTFSMYQAIGDIERSTGYTDSVIIKNGRTVPGIGGGVCQVSTSLFRAALNAGFPITERRPHSFRVSYYEQDSPPGLDAAVYFPDWDFKFRNDTSNHMIIQTILDETNTKLQFNFWGVSDQRQVALSAPEITDRRPSPPEIRIPSDEVPKGIIRQTEFAAEGAKVTITRTINKNNNTVTDKIISLYRPWQSVFLIGTLEN